MNICEYKSLRFIIQLPISNCIKLNQHSSVNRAFFCSMIGPGSEPNQCLVKQNGSCTMLATKRSAGVTPEAKIREYVTCTPLPSVNKADHSGFETPSICHQKS